MQKSWSLTFSLVDTKGKKITNITEKEQESLDKIKEIVEKSLEDTYSTISVKDVKISSNGAIDIDFDARSDFIIVMKEIAEDIVRDVNYEKLKPGKRVLLIKDENAYQYNNIINFEVVFRVLDEDDTPLKKTSEKLNDVQQSLSEINEIIADSNIVLSGTKIENNTIRLYFVGMKGEIKELDSTIKHIEENYNDSGEDTRIQFVPSLSSKLVQTLKTKKKTSPKKNIKQSKTRQLKLSFDVLDYEGSIIKKFDKESKNELSDVIIGIVKRYLSNSTLIDINFIGGLNVLLDISKAVKLTDEEIAHTIEHEFTQVMGRTEGSWKLVSTQYKTNEEDKIDQDYADSLNRYLSKFKEQGRSLLYIKRKFIDDDEDVYEVTFVRKQETKKKKSPSKSTSTTKKVVPKSTPTKNKKLSPKKKGKKSSKK